ncbi:MAG: AMP-binding protein [Ideonella sp.]|nr:AMP-binding protein [Ideonella sp.]
MQTIPQLLVARARDSGDRTFCTFKGKNTTFAALTSGVTEMAGALAAAGATPGNRVALMLPPSIEHMQLYLACSWLGVTAVPFSIHLKAAGLELQLASCRPAVMVASRSHEAAITAALAQLQQPLRIVWFEDGPATAGGMTLDALLGKSRAIALPVERSLDDSLAIMYTSGTTGAPKGVVQSERWFWVGAKNAGVLSEANANDTFFMWEPFYHIAAWMTVMMALQHGLSVYMVDRFSASRLWDQIGEAGATKFHYLGGIVNIMLAQPVTAAEKDNTVKIAWGAACPTDSWRRFEERFGVIVREGYGISEGQNFTHLNMEGVVGSIGKPVDEFESWLADAQGKRVPLGAVGEIVLRPKVAGVVMTEYFGEPEKTRDVLRADGNVYTGDTATQDADGNFYFKGRKKDALRRRGENVSAWEVERVLNAHPSVEESAVLGVPSELGEQDILAVVKLKEGVEGDPMELVKFAGDKLTYYQVPRYIQYVEDFPRGPTQRIKKNDIAVDLKDAWDSEKAGYKSTRNT